MTKNKLIQVKVRFVNKWYRADNIVIKKVISIKKTLTMQIVAFIMALMAITSITSTAQADAVYKDVVDPYHQYSYEEMLENAQELQLMYPELIRLKSIGKSVEGRDLLLIELGNGGRKVFLNGATHAREYISTTYLMYMIDRYAYAYSNGGIFDEHNIKEILNGVTFCIIPMVNPDGVNLVQNGIYSAKNYDAVSKITINNADNNGYSSWKANIRGVDLNRNYPNNWHASTLLSAPASSGFKGYSPLSEPETKAIVNCLNSNMYWSYISFHSQGEGIYGWNDANAGYYPQLNSMVSRIIEVSGFKKLTDTPDTSYGTFADYARETYLKPTLTIELCKYVGSYPYPNEDFESVWGPAKSICLIAAEEVMKMGNQEYLVYNNNTFLHAFCDKGYALAYAKKWSNSKVLFVEGGIDSFKSIVPANITLLVNDSNVVCQAYNLDGSNYIKLRDLAFILSNTDKQFEVGYDSINNTIMLTSGMAYTAIGGELTPSNSTAISMVMLSKSKVYLDGAEISLKAYNIDGSNYFNLRDQASALNLGITYDSTTRTIRIDKSATPE